MTIEAMKQALEALEYTTNLSRFLLNDEANIGPMLKADEAITSLRQAIEQAEKQEPVAIYQYQLASGSWIDQTKNSYDYNVRHGQATVRVVYTTPQPQQAEKQDVEQSSTESKETFDQPVAWMCSDESLLHKGYSRFSRNCEGAWNIPVYTTPPQREWVGLTDEEINDCDPQEDCWGLHEVARAIEAKLRSKNQ
jgi:hypothetical protein